MKLELTEVVDRFYEQVQEKYPELTKEQVKEIITSPFMSFRKSMERNEIKIYRFQYLGTFYVSLSKAKNSLVKLESNFREQKIEPPTYFRLRKMLTEFIERKDEELLKQRKSEPE
jgi:hypothetical protein